MDTSSYALTPGPITETPVVDMPRYMRIREFSILTAIKPRLIYELLSRGSLRGVKVGRCTLIDVRAGLKWLDNQPSVQIRPMHPPRTAPPDHQAA
jgi:hypothetical protein